MVNDTFVTASFFIDPNSSQVFYAINNAEPVGVVNTNLPNNEELTVTLAVQAGEAAAKSLVVDYVSVLVER
jgi:hypothetical protein